MPKRLLELADAHAGECQVVDAARVMPPRMDRIDTNLHSRRAHDDRCRVDDARLYGLGHSGLSRELRRLRVEPCDADEVEDPEWVDDDIERGEQPTSEQESRNESAEEPSGANRHG